MLQVQLKDGQRKLSIQIDPLPHLPRDVKEYWIDQAANGITILEINRIWVWILQNKEGEVAIMKIDKLMKEFEEKKEEFYKELLEKEEQELKKARKRKDEKDTNNK